MSTDFFRRYLDLLNEATGQTPTDFTPTHFHKNNLGSKIPLMQTPDGSFWWETTATSDDGGPVQRGSARKSIQPWIGDTENRSSGFSGKSSVDGVFKNGEAIEFPEGMTWKEYAASAEKSPQAALPSPAKVKEIPHINPGELVPPNTNVALPSSGTFSNDQALANLAAQMKDGNSAIAATRLSKDAVSGTASTGNKTDSSDSLYLLKQIKGWGDMVSKLPDTMDPNSPNAEGERRNNVVYMQQLVDLLKEMSELPAGSVSDVTLQQVEEIYRSSLKKIKSREASVEASTQSPEKDKAVAGGRASGASVGSDSGSRWAYVPGDGTSKDISGKKDSGGLPSLAGADAASKKSGKETMITDSSHCDQCGTPKSLHAPLKHEFVAGDDVRPAAVGGSAPSSDRSVKPASDTLAADQARIDKMPAWDRSKNAPVGATPPPPSVKGPPSKPSFFKEDINRLPAADQMRSWRQLMEADPPKLIVGPDQFDSPEQIRARAAAARNAGKPAPPPPETPGHRQINPDSPLGRAQAAGAPKEPMSARGIPGMDAPAAPAAPAAPSTSWKTKAELGLKKLARPLNAAYAVYEGWQQIKELPRDKMTKAQYAAAITKIVAKLIEENGIFLVSSELGMLAGGAIGGVGAIPGFIAGGVAGMAAEYYFGDDISAVVNGLVDKLYGTGPAPASQENKLNPQQIGELKQWVSQTEAWIAAGNKLDKDDQDYLNRVKAALKAAGVAVAPAPQAAEKVPVADSVARYKETFDKANAIVDKIKNLNPKVLDPKDPAFDPKAIYNLRGEIISLFANEIGIEGQKDPAVAKQMDSIYEVSKAAADAKYAEAEGKGQPATSGPKEGQTGMYDGKKVIYRNGKWVYQ